MCMICDDIVLRYRGWCVVVWVEVGEWCYVVVGVIWVFGLNC